MQINAEEMSIVAMYRTRGSPFPCDAFSKIIGWIVWEMVEFLGFYFYYNIGIHRTPKNNEQPFLTSTELVPAIVRSTAGFSRNFD